MPEPSVCAILLTANRPAMAKQAVAHFKKQTAAMERAGLKNFRLFILDTSEECADELLDKDTNVLHVYRPIGGLTIGQLRNAAIENAVVYWEKGDGPDILIHWDDDDYSHPNRISEQVALLQSSGTDCVGYNECLFWREPVDQQLHCGSAIPGEAWLYRNPDPQYALGTSLCYWRKTWERKPFEATSQGEDLRFIAGLKIAAVSGIGGHGCGMEIANFPPVGDRDNPRMIARIHPGNTSTAYKPEAMQREAQKRNGMWQRVPDWDSHCAWVFA